MTPLDVGSVPLAGTNLVEASAGTGKTHTITDLYARLVLECELSVGEILVVTYTNAATAELRTRIRRRLRDMLAAFESGPPDDDAFLTRFVDSRRTAGRAPQDSARLLAALHSFDEAAIFTIHGFCQRVLREHAFESGAPFEADVVADESLLLTEVVRDFWVRALHAAPEPFVRSLEDRKLTLEKVEALALQAIVHPDMPVLPARNDLEGNAGDEHVRALLFQLDLVDYARREMRRRKEHARLESYDDLLHRVADALRKPGASALAQMIRERFRAALIDEFQDTDPVQYEIFRRVYLGTDATLFLIGDPKQSIYAFRGADVFAYMRAKRDVGGAVHTLGVNHRADASLVHALNALFSRLPSPFRYAAIPFLPVEAAPGARNRLGGSAAGQPPLEILFVPRHPSVQVGQRGGGIVKPWADAHLARGVAAEIVRFLASGATIDGRPVEPRDIAVLCRKNKEASRMQEALRQLGVPSVLQTDASVFEAPEAEEVERVLHAVADPGDAAAIRGALATVLLGQDAHDVHALERDEARWDEWLRAFQHWNELWTRRGFVAAFRALLDSQGVRERLLRLFDGERRLTNVLHVFELLHGASTEERRGPHALVSWLSLMRTDAAARAALGSETAQVRLESDAAAVMLTTVHKSKGLQYPIVYCPTLWDGRLLSDNDKKWVRFHAAGDGDRLTLDIGSSDHARHRRAAEEEAFAEQMRLLYVALTRARHRCSVVWGAFTDAETSALGYLLHAHTDDPEATTERIRGFLRSRNDGGLRDDLRSIVAAAPECLAVGDLDFTAVERYAPPAAATMALAGRTFGRRLDRTWRVSSFSGLTAAGPISQPSEEGVDHDATAGLPAEATVAVSETRVPLHEFPAGAHAGDCIHHLFERLDFQAGDAERRDAVTTALAQFGFEPQWVDPLCRALAGVLATPLQPADGGAPAFALRDLPLAGRVSELEFVLPVVDTRSSRMRATTEAASLTSGRLAEIFARYATATVPARYAEDVRRLGFAPLAGFLKGYIDLVFEHAGRWYLVDYKSNLLGPWPSDYQPWKLADVMAQHHYYLQYHLYLVALHRYLSVRVPGYAYERHFGGVFYLFLRGMAPEHGRSGVFFDRPSPAMVDALAAMLAPATAHRAPGPT